MNRLVFLNVETTGRDSFWDNVAQLSYLITDTNLNIIKAKNFYFNAGFVNDEATKKNGLTKEILKELSNGKKFKDFSDEIINDLKDAKIICYNDEFNRDFIYTEFYDAKIQLNLDENFFCIAEAYLEIFKLKEVSLDYFHYFNLKKIKYYLNITDKQIKKIVDTNFKDFESYNNAYTKIASIYLCYKEYLNIDIEKLKKEKEIRDQIRKEEMENMNDDVPF